MKTFKSYLAFAVVLSLLFAGCSKEDESSPTNEPITETAVLSFGAVLDDLANRSANKGHFAQVPDCEENAEPAVARVSISYTFEGEDVDKTFDVDIINDNGTYFTDYDGELEIPVSVDGDDDNTNDFTTVSLDGFMVYDGDPAADGTQLIWAAPTTVDFPNASFAGYVENPLPFNITVRPGVKKYVEVEVLCFDRRMVNQYGYLFFDIIQEELVPLCFFANYCDEDGRHYPGFYGIDLFVEDATGARTQIYNSTDSRPTIGDYNANNQNDPEYFAEPLCLVVPSPPDGVSDDEDYLFYTVTPLDWDEAYGEDADNTALAEVGLSWNEVQALLNGDGETNEYIHLFINCDEDDNTGSGENGDSDSDDDGVDDGDDMCPNTPPNTNVNSMGCPDADKDGVKDSDDMCPDTPPNTDVDATGCPVDQTPMTCDLTIPDPDADCDRGVTPGSQDEDYANNGEFLMINPDVTPVVPMPSDEGSNYGPDVASLSVQIVNGGVNFIFDIDPNATITDYLIEVKDTANGDVTCTTTGLTNGDEVFVPGNFTGSVFIRVKINVCGGA